MAVRFLPAPEDRTPTPQPERENIAEVIELRARLGEEPGAPRADREDPADVEDFNGLEDPADLDGPNGLEDPVDLEGLNDHEDLVEQDDHDDPLDEARRDGIAVLARRARSSGEVRAALLERDHAAETVDIVIDEFIADLYLDDVALARAQMEKLRTAKRASRAQIHRKLRERRLPDAVIDQVLEDLDDDDEFALLREAAEKRAEKLRDLDRATAERRLMGYLARRGWGGEPALRAVREALAGATHSKGGVRFQ